MVTFGGQVAWCGSSPEVLVVTDVVAEAGEFLVPTEEHPGFYVFLGGKERTLGQPIAGERLPAWPHVRDELESVLAKQHYHRTDLGGPKPTLVLVCTWGSANLDLDTFEETDNATGETSINSVVFNAREFAQLTGLTKRSRQRLSRQDQDRLATVLREDRLYLLVAALDAESLALRQPKLVWRTWISIPSLRHSLPAELATMLRVAAPNFGRDTAQPFFWEETSRRAEVEIGETTVIGAQPTVP